MSTTNPLRAHRLATREQAASIEDVAGVLLLDGPAMPRAACKDHPAHLWDDRLDPDYGPPEQAPERAARHDKARGICAGCPERAVCRQVAAEDTNTKYPVAGIWAGELHAHGGPRSLPEPDTLPVVGRCQVCQGPLPARRQRNCSDHCRKAAELIRRKERRDEEAEQTAASLLDNLLRREAS